MRAKNVFYMFAIYFLILNLIGCDAFVRKFTRKPKKDELPQEEMVLVPEEYKPTMTKEDLYRQYLLYWKSWQDELIESLVNRGASTYNYKKQLSCAEQAIKNLEQLKALLNEEKQKELDKYIVKMRNLQAEIRDNSYPVELLTYRAAAERLRRAILRDFSFNKVKGSLL